METSNEISRYRWWILLGLITAAIMEVLDTTIVNVALPQMAGNLGATFQEIAWVSTGYILSNVVVLPMTAFLAGRFGRKRYLGFSILLFIAASFFCGTSHTLIELVFWRITQGAGGAALLSTAQATLRQIFPTEQQGIVQAIFLMGVIVAPTLGPTLGGWITDNYTWNWCFFINIPIGLVSFFLVTTFLEDSVKASREGSVDWLGIGLLAVGLGSLQYVLEEGQRNDWFQDATICKLTALSVVTIAVLLWWEMSPRNTHPVVNFKILKNSALSSSIFLFVALGFGLYGGVYLFPLFAQTILGLTPTKTGLVLLPGGLATACSALICGRLLNGRKALIDPRILIVVGICIFMLSMLDLSHLTILSGEDDTRVALLIRGFGLGFLFTPINQVAYASVERHEAQQASGLINLARQLGGSFGIAILGTYLTNRTNTHYANLAHYTYPSNHLFTDRIHGIAAAFQSHGYSAVTANKMAIGAISQGFSVQAMTESYNDAFFLILIIFFLTAPAILLLRKPKPIAVAIDAH
ncbi:MAG: DHA2 family efflux MFS transporter permease subunit [Fimbriimonas sp.]|nr:DHA2 family efflux MFS transporter permease subunit [Fimbriimonas sp.]